MEQVRGGLQMLQEFEQLLAELVQADFIRGSDEMTGIGTDYVKFCECFW